MNQPEHIARKDHFFVPLRDLQILDGCDGRFDISDHMGIIRSQNQALKARKGVRAYECGLEEAYRVIIEVL